jgi:HlyD family secretion protein
MSRSEWLFRWSWRRALLGLAVLATLVTAGVRAMSNGLGAAANIDTAEVVRGEFVERLVIRGEVKAVRSLPVVAPSSAGDLQIVTLAKNGGEVRKGELLVQFDATAVERALAEKRSLLKQAEAEIERARAQSRIQEEGTLTEQMKGRYEVERAKLDVGTREVISRIDAEKAVLKLSDAEQKVREVDAKLAANRAAARAEIAALEQKRQKALMDVQIEERRLAALTVRAPMDGLFMVGQNFRAGGPFGAREFRAGDRGWPGSVIGELPELTSPYVLAKLEEIDRGRLAVGMEAIVVVEALPGLELPAKLASFSTLAKPDYSTWPPPRTFDMAVDLGKSDPRLRPAMTASIRIPVDRLTGTLLIPSRALMHPGGAAYVYVLRRNSFERRPVTVARRNQDQVAIADGLKEGERVALEEPDARTVAD